MGIFDSIKNAIFHRPARTTPGQASTAQRPAQGAPTASRPAAQATPASAAPAKTPTAQPQAVDVESVLDDLAAKNPQKLNWRSSIVDLMKLVELDSSFGNRKELAKELGYSGDANDSAAMNVWLHKQVMNKLAENGGKVPSDLRH
jgi:hypothetical protein